VLIDLNRVKKVYPPNQIALNDISLSVSQGEFVFIAGASGAGKSTLLKLLFGAILVTEGNIKVNGIDLLSASTLQIQRLRQQIGVVFQDYQLLPRRTVIDNVLIPFEVINARGSATILRAKNILERVGLLDKVNHLPDRLSGGEQQRVALARALVHDPQILIADEPTGNLDMKLAREIMEIFVEAQLRGVTVLVASHNLMLMEEFKRRTIVLDQGKLIGDFKN
jgi:cell division transport system ATP-binding protein